MTSIQDNEPACSHPRYDPTCREVINMLVEYVAGELEPNTAQTLQEHFRNCADCLAFLRTYQSTIRLTRSVRATDLPGEMHDRILQVLRNRPPIF